MLITVLLSPMKTKSMDLEITKKGELDWELRRLKIIS
jgi:hypothetical protein